METVSISNKDIIHNATSENFVTSPQNKDCMNEAIERVVKILNQGGIIIFPTDTAFGIGCRIDKERSIERLFKIRKRPENQAVPVLVSSIEMARRYIFSIPQEVINKLIKPYWPGALTIILKCNLKKVPKLVRGGGDTLGVRIPNNKIILEIIKGVGVPILGPSANFHGGKTPHCVSDLDKDLVKMVDYVIPGVCQKNKISTVIDCSVSPWKIIRQGAIQIHNSKRAILIIDTSDRKETKIGLRINNIEYWIQRKMGIQKSQVILPMIEKILEKHNLDLENLEEIEVNIKSDSFTGVRVGIAVANALSYALNIPINNMLEAFVEPVYD